MLGGADGEPRRHRPARARVARDEAPPIELDNPERARQGGETLALYAAHDLPQLGDQIRGNLRAAFGGTFDRSQLFVAVEPTDDAAHDFVAPSGVTALAAHEKEPPQHEDEHAQDGEERQRQRAPPDQPEQAAAHAQNFTPAPKVTA